MKRRLNSDFQIVLDVSYLQETCYSLVELSTAASASRAGRVADNKGKKTEKKNEGWIRIVKQRRRKKKGMCYRKHDLTISFMSNIRLK